MPHPVESPSEALAKAIVVGNVPGSDPGYLAPLETMETIATWEGWSDLAAFCKDARTALEACGDKAPTPELLDQLERIVLRAADLVEGRQPVHAPAKPAAGENDELLTMFVAGAAEAIASLEQLLLQLEENPNNPEAWAELRRNLHTLKGECGVLSLGKAQALLHESESLVDRALAGTAAGAVDTLLPVVDWMRLLLAGLHAGELEEPGGSEALIGSLQRRPETNSSSSSAKPRPSATSPVGGTPVASRSSGGGSETPNADDAAIEFPAELLADESMPDFITEARQHLESSEGALLLLETTPSDPEPINVVFRAFHTIKGVAGFLNLKPVVELAHSTETLLDEARQGKQLLSPAHIGIILASNDLMGRLLGALAGEPAPKVQELRAHLAHLDAAIRGELSALSSETPRLQQVLSDLGCHSAEELEAATRAPETVKTKLGQLLLERTSLTQEQLSDALKTQQRLATKGRKVRIGELLVELGLVSADEVATALANRDGSSPVAQFLSVPAPNVALESESTKKPRLDSTVVVATQRLDLLVDMVGELVIAQQMVVQDEQLTGLRNDRLARNLSQVVKITRDLQEASMSLRMVTFKSTFQKMSRLVRDVAAKSEKDVAFTMSGADTEVDRTVVEKISDPLIHILRNAIDHGLETPTDRQASGKSAKGNLTLRAYTKSGSIVIEVSDDGRGIHRDKILAKALAVGLVQESQRPHEWPDNEVFKLIFAAGFSTAERVTDISGRGVGMDVVRRNIEGMRGKIEIESSPGKGSKFLLKLPLTLAIIDGMVVRAGAERYVIPTASIVQSFRPLATASHRFLNDGELIDVRGGLVPVFSLQTALDRPFAPSPGGDRVVILVESTDGKVCLAADQLVGQQQVVIKNLGKAVPRLAGVAGGAILSDGQVALILDVDKIIQRLVQKKVELTA